MFVAPKGAQVDRGDDLAAGKGQGGLDASCVLYVHFPDRQFEHCTS